MAMGVVSDDEFKREEKNSSVPAHHGSDTIVVERTVPSLVIDMPTKGRQQGSVAVPESLQKIIGETSVLEGRAEALKFASELGISPSSVSAYAKGATSTASYNEPSESIINHLIATKSKRAKMALKVMKMAMNGISDEKLQASSAKELSSVAKDMAGVVRHMEPPAEDNGNNKQQPQFVVYAPQFRDERSYETITVKE